MREPRAGAGRERPADRDAGEIGDARLCIFRTRRGLQLCILGSALTLGIFLGLLTLGVIEVWTGEGGAPPIDLIVFWGAAKLAVQGAVLDAFDVAKLAASHGATTENWLPWVYPPGFLVLVAPLGFVDFGTAWILMSVASIAAIALAVRNFTGRSVPVLLGFALAPAYLPALMLGQATLLWVAGLLAALAALRAGRPVIAGVLIGCLTLKPQLGLLIPVALLADRQWKAIAVAAVTAVLVAALPTLWVGIDYWSALGEMATTHFEHLKEDAPTTHLMPSVYTGLRGLGFDHEAATALQWGVTGLAALMVARAWASRDAGFDLKTAVLLVSIPVATPYLWYYDAAFTAPAALMLVRAGVLPRGPAGVALLFMMFLGAGPAGVAELLTPDILIPVRYLVLPVLLLGFAVGGHASLRPRRGPVEQAA